MEQLDFTAPVNAIHELKRRSFKSPVADADWSRHEWERELNIEMLNSGDIDGLIGWVITSEGVSNFIEADWVVQDKEGDAVRLRRDDGSDIYIAPAGERFITFLDLV